MAVATIDVAPLSGALGSGGLGAEVRGLDLTRPLDGATEQALRDAWTEHLVLVIRGQRDLSVEDQRRFCRVFGALGDRTRPKETRREGDGAPEGVMFVSNLKKDGKFIGSLPEGEMQFHIDQCYTASPATGTCLYAIEIPPEGGDTMFTNLYAAWERLPPDLRNELAARKAMHYFDYGTTRNEGISEEQRATLPHYAHPVGRVHPLSHRTALYVCRLMTDHIEGLSERDSRNVLDVLFDAVENPAYRYTHKWRVGDLLLWDNRCTAHARTDFDPNQRRHLRRFTIQGEQPV
jgi:taurine dioxygenase